MHKNLSTGKQTMQKARVYTMEIPFFILIRQDPLPLSEKDSLTTMPNPPSFHLPEFPHFYQPIAYYVWARFSYASLCNEDQFPLPSFII
ncbi:hypothetical protein CEXT_776821 [Caerostris extrusa]|uniref:Uncharacterized protein n=1 Tax=Caerostris extrusa TaxID=172846 RepID=A0AAV4WGT8_CAEEX|nr:hypothetical protein CEXT_776821 [Caerostris extrusa]